MVISIFVKPLSCLRRRRAVFSKYVTRVCSFQSPSFNYKFTEALRFSWKLVRSTDEVAVDTTDAQPTQSFGHISSLSHFTSTAGSIDAFPLKLISDVARSSTSSFFNHSNCAVCRRQVLQLHLGCYIRSRAVSAFPEACFHYHHQIVEKFVGWIAKERFWYMPYMQQSLRCLSETYLIYSWSNRLLRKRHLRHQHSHSSVARLSERFDGFFAKIVDRHSLSILDCLCVVLYQISIAFKEIFVRLIKNGRASLRYERANIEHEQDFPHCSLLLASQIFDMRSYKSNVRHGVFSKYSEN